ncbi:uncharacterized protein LOC18431475 isoform X1 [Amborella trichopoda]|uniref:Uncharacterized protein n=3 Tax=Amborella trichopoda TaxID=13333 RepID=W1P604_AMBTC|nr:uncharacterized protein LOC18431475 isoform X1 [Amborella trichopoda]XP_011622300.1 uncharacterized protein LOC18431475 isoform X1 [Amborella trichopoda]XP_011622301.1 uncharacterized protein LOC18431475 isoform X1 [Amborella trichopoda]ERN03338.1 hypothetical protein AMTR_s00003p00241710 [Amborella trichopoda]|eukprot:XP_006841663.1 uncharacterized protein LOC18431475 isoform X1 [Amborella trichopoda]
MEQLKFVLPSSSSSSCYYSAMAVPLVIPASSTLAFYCKTRGRLRPFGITQSRLAIPQRTDLLSVSAIWDALTGGGAAREASMAIRQGMQLFRQGDVQGSLDAFDKAIELDPRQKAYLWQRGLSLYYLSRFEEGAKQFRLDVAKNPNDTEESIWCFLCEAQLCGPDEARRCFLEVARDPRPVMREAYTMFKDGGDPDKLVSTFLYGKENEYFYAALYAGLYYESQNDSKSAKNLILAASQSPYALRSDDYMASLSKVHCNYRDWHLS